MSTSRSNKDSRCTVDLGAQYISATPDYQQKHAKFVFRIMHVYNSETLNLTTPLTV